MISHATFQDYNLPTGRDMKRDYTITVYRENGVKLDVPVQTVHRTTNSRWWHWAALLIAAGLGCWGMWWPL